MVETVLAACDECGAESGEKCGPMCTAPFGPGGPYEYMSPDDEHPAVTAAIAALAERGVSARVVRPDGRAYLLEVALADESKIWIGAPEFLPEVRWPEESATGWVANHMTADENDFIDAPYYAWDNPDPAPMAEAVAAYLAAR